MSVEYTNAAEMRAAYRLRKARLWPESLKPKVAAPAAPVKRAATARQATWTANRFKKWTPEEEATLIAMLRARESTGVIAARTGRSRKAIKLKAQWLKNNGRLR